MRLHSAKGWFRVMSLLATSLWAGCGGGGAASPVEGVAAYRPIAIVGDNSPSGIFDPSVIATSDGKRWMSYSSVDYYMQAGRLVQDVGTRLARSDDGGRSFTYVATIATPQATTVTDTGPSQPVCGQAQCNGRWVYETSWLVDDSTDPNPARRYKLFAHKYFLYPPHTPATIYTLGAIVMRTASAPDAAWSAESVVLGWNLTPPELPFTNNLNTIDAALASCLVVSEGAASFRGSTLDFAFSCPYFDSSANAFLQKIVMLRSSDHAATFQYVATLLQPDDAATFGGDYFSAPSLLPGHDGSPVLIATPVIAGSYSGCVVIPFASEQTGTLRRTGGVPVNILRLPAISGHFGGACAWDRSLAATGVLLNDVDPSVSPVAFRILATHASF